MTVERAICAVQSRIAEDRLNRIPALIQDFISGNIELFNA
jgi:hypothetical protein